MYTLIILWVTIIGYLIGSINFSLVVGFFYKIDIRQYGSGNAGLTNTFRTLGKIPAILVLLGDVSKGIISCIVGNLIVENTLAIENLGLLISGFAAVIGHNWPIYFKFKGGKGILTTFTVILMMNYKIGLILFGIFLVVVLVTRYVSLGSIIGSLAFPLLSYFYMTSFNLNLTFVYFATSLSLVAILRHKSNIIRIISKSEHKISFKK